jgi:hypothetical protein
VGGVAEEGHPAVVEGGQRLGEVVHVVAEHVLGARGGQDRGDRVVPVAEPAQQFRLLVVGRPLSGGGEGGRVGVDPAVLEGWLPQMRPRPQVSWEANRAPGSGITIRQVVNPE